MQYASAGTWARGRVAVLVAGGAALLLAGALALALARGVGGPELGEAGTGFEVAPDFTLPTFEGGSFTLSEHAGRPVFIYFWASWCAPCYREAPVIQRLWPEFEAAGYTFVGVNMMDHEQDARAFIEEFDLTFPMAYDHDEEVYLEYGVYGLPEAFFLAPGLEVEHKYVGELDEQELRELLVRLAPEE